MPPVALAVGGIFLSAGAIVGTIAGLAAITVAGIGLATVLTVAGVALLAVGYLTMKKIPKPGSSGQQLDLKVDTKAPVPVVYGRTATGGFLIYREALGAKNVTLAMAIALSAGGPVQAVESYYGSDRLVSWSGNPASSMATCNGAAGLEAGSKLWKGKLKQRWSVGEKGAAASTITAESGLSLPFSPGKISGIAHAVQLADYDTDAFSGGLPRGLWVLSGVKVYDPRKDSTYPGGSGSHRISDNSTFEFSENPYLCALDWTLGRFENGRKVYGIGAQPSEVDIAAFVAGANIADANGWKVGGAVATSDDKYAVLATILQSGGGRAIAGQGRISVSYLSPKTSLYTISEDDLIGDVDLQTTTAWRDRKNSITPRYREETQLWQIVAGDQLSVPAYVTQDKGLRETEVEFTMVQNATQAKQLAAYELLNAREFLTYKIKCKPKFLNIRVGDCVTVNAPTIAVNGQKSVVVAREFDPATYTVALTLKSETDAKHDFALSKTATAPASPALSTYDPSAPAAPASGSWGAITSTIGDGAGNLTPSIRLTGASDDPNAVSIIVEYKKASDSTWTQYGVYSANTTAIDINGVAPSTAYNIAVSYRTARNATGARLVLSATSGTVSLLAATNAALTAQWDNITGDKKADDNASLGDNLIGNAAISTDTSGWAQAGGWSRQTPTSIDPGYFWRSDGTVSQLIPNYFSGQRPVFCVSNKMFLSAKVRFDRVSTNLTGFLYCYDAAGTYLGAYSSGLTVTAANVWQTSNVVFTGLPVNFAKFVLQFVAFHGTGGVAADFALPRLSATELQATLGSTAGTNLFQSNGTTVMSQAEVRTPEGIAAGITGQAATATSSDFAVITGSTKPAANAGTSGILLPIGSFTTVTGNSIVKSGGTHGADQGGVVGAPQRGSATISATVLSNGVALPGGGWQTRVALDTSRTNYSVSGTTYWAVWIDTNGGTGSLSLYTSTTLLGSATTTGATVASTIELVYDGIAVTALFDGVPRASVAAAANQVLYPKVLDFYNSGEYGFSIRNILFGNAAEKVWANFGGDGKPENYATVGENLIFNGNAEIGTTDGWSIVENNGSGPNQLVIDAAAASNGRYGFILAKSAVGDGANAVGRPFPVVPGKQYVVRVTLSGSSATSVGLYIRMQERVVGASPTSGYSSSTDLVSYAAIPATATVYNFLYTVPAGVGSVAPSLYNWVNGPLQLRFDDFQMIEAKDFATIVGSTKPEANATLGARAGTNIFQTNGTTILTQADIRTIENISAGITGQGAFATINNVDLDNGSRVTLPYRMAAHPDWGANYFDAGRVAFTSASGGNSLQNLRPAEYGSNVTESRISSGITGQGSLATRSSITDGYLSGNLATRLAAHPLNSQYLSMATVAYPDGANADLLKPQEAGSNKTESRISSGIYGQGDLATANRSGLQFGANAAINSDFVKGFAGGSAIPTRRTALAR